MSARRLGAFVALLAAGLLPRVASDYYVQMAAVAMLYAIAAQGYDILLGWAGQFALSQAAFFGIGAYSVALLSTKADLPYWFALLAALPITVLAAMLVGAPMLRLRGHYLAMGTLAFGLSVELVLARWAPVTGGTDGIRNIPAPAVAGLALDSPTRYYYLSLAALLLVLWITARLWRSGVGGVLGAVRTHETTAAVLGVNVAAAKMLALGLGAAYAALGGGLYAGLFRYVSPETYGLHTAVLLLLMVVLGGSRTLAGPTLGAFLLIALPEALRFMADYYLMVYGLAVIIIVSFLPGGLVGLWRMVVPQEGGGTSAPHPIGARIAETLRRP